MHLILVTDAWHPQVSGVVRTLDSIIQILEERGFNITIISPQLFYTVPMPFYPEIGLSVWPKNWGKRVRTIFDTSNADYVYIATEGPLGLLARDYCMRRNMRYTSGFHTKFPEYASEFGIIGGESFGYHFIKWFHASSHTVLVPTQSILDELAEQGIENMTLWTRGVDSVEFQPLETSVLQNVPRPILLNVGRVSPEKGLENFLDADVPGTKVIVGDGPSREVLEMKYPEAMFVGKKSGKELVEYYSAADVFVFPSKTDTFGIVQLEALACATPVAAYPVPSPIDVIKSPDIGVLHEDLEVAITNAQKLDGNKCREYVLQNHTWEKAADIFQESLVSTY